MKHAAVLSSMTIALAMLCGPALAQGQVAYTAKTVNMRAGPARDYPVVAVLAPGLQILVEGCLGDYSWCDVVAGPSRGWVYAGNISYAYQNNYAPILTYGAVIGLPIIAFALDDYWGHHYRDRPWYRDRYRWEHAHVRPPLRPRPVPAPGAIAPRPRPHEGVPPSGWPAPQPGARPRAGVPPSGWPAPQPGAHPRAGVPPSGGPAPQPGARPHADVPPSGWPAPQAGAQPRAQPQPRQPRVGPGARVERPAGTPRAHPARPEGAERREQKPER